MRAGIALSREGLARVRIRPRRGRRAALARWRGRVSAVSHTRRTSSHEPQYQYTAIYTAVGPPAVLASLKPPNNIIQLPPNVPCVVSNNYTAIGSGLYITKTRCLLIYWPQYVHTYLQCYTLVLVVRAV